MPQKPVDEMTVEECKAEAEGAGYNLYVDFIIADNWGWCVIEPSERHIGDVKSSNVIAGSELEAYRAAVKWLYDRILNT